MREKRKHKYINDFPIIIIIIVAIITIILGNLYLSFKPYGRIYKDGYMVLSSNMTNNLVNNTTISDDMNIGVARVSNGDYLYKQADSYYVGIKEKEEIDMDYPIYSSDGLTIYNMNENIKLVNSDFEILNGYSGLSLNFGILYNDGDEEPADNSDYILESLENSIYINTQVMTINTVSNEYTIPINSPIYFGLKYINYYAFDGKNFNYQRIDDIYYDSIIRIGNVRVSYEEFLTKLNLIKLKEIDDITNDTENKDNNESKTEIVTEDPIESKEEIVNYIKPSVSVNDFDSSVYSINSTIKIDDPLGVITSEPTFELYSNDKLYSRKKVLSSGGFNISGLESDTEYKIIGKYKYKNNEGQVIISTFYEGTAKTKSIDELDEITVSSELGKRYSNKIEIKNFKITNYKVEAVSGVRRIDLLMSKQGTDEQVTYTIPYEKMKELLQGKTSDIITNGSLKSNTVYEYEVKFYDKNENILKSSGDIKGIVNTSKASPSISFKVNVDEKNKVVIDVNTKNDDSVIINDYSYELYTKSGSPTGKKGNLDFNESTNRIEFSNLDYDRNYILKISGVYDLEDGNGVREINETKEFSTIDLSKKISVWYDKETKNVTSDSINVDVYLGQSSALEREDTVVDIYLADENGKDIKNSDGSLKHIKEYTKNEYTNPTSFSDYSMNVEFSDLNSNTIYTLKYKIKIKQSDDEDLIIEKAIYPVITTKAQEAYLKIIKKRLAGDNLEFSFDVVDDDTLIKNNRLIVEIYEGNYTSVKALNEAKNNSKTKIIKYVYRNSFNISDENISINLRNYNADKYTILVYSDHYKDDSGIKKYLSSKNSETDLINLDRNISVHTEMYQQKKTGSKIIIGDKQIPVLKTEINLKLDYENSQDDIFLVDCANGSCTNLGYLGYDDSDQKWHVYKNDSSTLLAENIYDSNKSVSYKLSFNNKNESEEHSFYAVITKPEILLDSDEFSVENIDKNLYVLSELNYSTEYEIFNIHEAGDFLDTSLMKRSGETRHYVVTSDIDFNSYEVNQKISNFKGTIDFQGHSLELYKKDDTGVMENYIAPFNVLESTSVLKNVILNYHLNFSSIVSPLVGFVRTNRGTIQNIIVNVEQENEAGRFSNGGLIAYENQGIIEKFAVYLKSNIHTYNYSSIITYLNTKTGRIKSGYIASDPKFLEERKIILHDTASNHGTFVYNNNGTIENVYNLVSVESAESSFSGGIATMSRDNSLDGVVKNTLSVATTTQNSSRTGPSLIKVLGKSTNNYYVDTDFSHLSYTSKYNKKVNVSVLGNAGFFEVLLNRDNDFSIIPGYYPIVKMSSFMNNKQLMTPVIYQINSSKVDILSSEVLNNNTGEHSKARIKIYVSNPNKEEITEIKIANLTTEILEQNYDETNQITEVIVGAYLSKLSDVAKNNYDITKITYKKFSGLTGSRTYDEYDRRSIDLEMYRHVTTYNSLINYINNNENIYLDSNITLVKMNLDLPDNKSYSAIFDGNQKTIDFNDNNISRGYFIYSLDGTIKNLQVKRLNFDSSSSYIGFIRTSINSIVDNVDISDSNISILGNQGTMYIGFLMAKSSNSNVSRVSVNDSNIIRKDNTAASTSYIGGIKGYSSDTDILDNSYVYNLNINEKEKATIVNIAIGGLVGFLSGSDSRIKSCYSDGNITAYSSNIGGIVGKSSYTHIEDSYSSMNISSTGDYIGGIIGKMDLGAWNSSWVTRNMYIGNIDILNENYHYAAITPSDVVDAANDNYALVEDTHTKNVTVINTDQFIKFDDIDKYRAFAQESNNLPYLIDSSFVTQQIKDKEYRPSVVDIKYEIQYNQNDFSPIINDVNKDGAYLTSNLYNHAKATSATLRFLDSSTLVINDGKNEDQTLNITTNEDGTYTLEPIKYLNNYKVKIKTGNDEIDFNLKDLSFYRQVGSQDDWKQISKSGIIHENVLLVDDIVISENASENFSKRINNLLGDNHTISAPNITLINRLIYENEGQIRDVNFTNIKIERTGSYTGIIRQNKGKIINVVFSNIDLASTADAVGIVATNFGEIDNVNLNEIQIKGPAWVGGLVAYYGDGILQRPGINHVIANNITVEATKGSYAGGIAGYVQFPIQNVVANNIKVKGLSYTGGIAGYSHYSNITISNSEIIGSDRVGGVCGYKITNGAATNVTVDNLNITATGSYVGGIGGYGYRIGDSSVSNTTIAKKTSEDEPTYINSSTVGGVCGECQGVYNNFVNNVEIYAKGNVGGIVGYEKWDGIHVTNNIVLNSIIKAEKLNAGGIIGYLPNGYTPYVIGNQVIKTNVEGKNRVGGITGLIRNDDSLSQNLKFSGNSVIASNIIATENAGGGLIGLLHQVPNSTGILFDKSLFYGNCENCGLVGSIEFNNTGSSTGYGTNPLELNKFYEKSTFKEFKQDIVDSTYQINTVSDVNSVLNNTNYQINISDEDGKNYFPILKSYYGKLNKEDWIEIPNSGSSIMTLSMSPKMMMRSMSLRNYSSSYNNPINLDYEVYSSDVDKVNIDFSDIDSSVSFYYKIGSYESANIPITSRTYTISYDFKTPIEIYVGNGSNYKTSRINPQDLQKTITLVNGKTYYINNSLLYGEDVAITGNFVNLYGNSVLTSEGKIYNISSKKEKNASIDYSVLPNSKPLYTFTYNSQSIDTYYTYSTVNSNIKNYQIFIKNGVLNVINDTLSNKKDSYIIDYYNDNEIQIILGDDGILYSLKNNIKYPNAFINRNIKELYTDMNSSNNIVTVKYNNGYVYTFNYRTGEEIFNNQSEDNTSLIDFVKNKLSNSNNSTIENITNYDKYTEIKLLKDKIMKTSVEDASNKISNNNSSFSNKANYIISYNEITKGYDVYNVDQIFDESLDLKSENDKINKSYELVQFYKELDKKQNKNSLNGLIVFGLSILAIIISLYLLIKKRKSAEVNI